MSETTTNTTTEAVVTTDYTLRKLEAKDVSLMASILSKIGMKEVKQLFMSGEIGQLVEDMTSGEKKASDEMVGIGVALEIANVILANYSKCEAEVFTFLASLSGLSKDEIASLSLADFFEMIMAVIRKDEFKDFMQVVSKLFK